MNRLFDHWSQADACAYIMDRIQQVPWSGCWLWDGAVDKDGYGKSPLPRRVRTVATTPMRSHRLAYEAFVGPIPNSTLVCHTCDVRSCVNPDHLFLGTPADNSADMKRKGRSPSMTGTRNGHAKLSEDDVLAIRRSARSNKSLARLYNVDRSMVSLIKSRKRWGHI